MNSRSIILSSVFAVMLLSPYVIEPAYYGFLAGFAALSAVNVAWNGVSSNLRVPATPVSVGCAAMILLAIYVVAINGPFLRDLLRDVGALFAFFIGRRMFMVRRNAGLQYDSLSALSLMGVLVSVVTVVAAVMAFRAGVSAYIWRGEYVPWAHTWLPFAIVANLSLMELDPVRRRTYVTRVVLCVFGTFASLSRTDLLLELFLFMMVAYRFRVQILMRVSGMVSLLAGSLVVFVLAVGMLRLPAVQQRVEAGVGGNDQSLGWRLMEHLALFEHFAGGTWLQLLFGFGLGARMPLPSGVLDFNGNDSIPHLHNSFGTILLKCGIAGLVFIGWFLWRLNLSSRSLHALPGEPYRRAGRWIVLLCLGKALTLQGLTEWSHLVFFGLGCMLMLNRPEGIVLMRLESRPGSGSKAVLSDP
jgi:hypothetical protein